ncbi:TPA: modification methylase [Candidatus Gastranaerophilales bacterium HUM_6]|nr:site-specific DNA-methyltransferase (Adenine-specific) [Fusobacterium sp. CAG:815]DAA86174.1 MAG TPA: modification methylase [Candidatus Gastranaerophilales bacterium HUM_2]DAA89408.1 MAG TPA: modification methylase [Candidatus Gastranaerophilales bacterium HUM_6]DAA93931.1 MAG TPA: modification methylase [Candidatus Gastranaerophilales bacterium HUM_7]DAB03489.1 MAG TPA: modification methylase [Candidatus Gastranaerophilales bacterium HUM_12]DAB07666.1 MAG TPA: modification methylase [Cand
MAVVLEQLKSETYPIVKWVGGKRQLMFELIKNMPKSYNRYFEPFIGGGALFFELQPEQAYISDMNEELINLYSVVRDNVYELIKDLSKHEVSKEYFLEIRNIDRTEQYTELSDVERASRFIYLNRTCFNGMYRVNSQGQFNVPFGHYKNPRIIDENNLLNCSELLKKTEIKCADFSEILTKVKKGDLVYFDPPYVPLNETSSFTSYTKDGFDINMQFKLRDVCDELDNKGVKFMLSNSDTKLVNELYVNYEIKKVFASRQINANADGRGKITEVLVRNYD